jgi:CRP/FNR family cyclic AMP-dependent transcriptional regulator
MSASFIASEGAACLQEEGPHSGADSPALRRGMQSCRWYRELPAVLRDALHARAVLRRLAPGTRLWARGDAFDGLYCVVEGAVRITGTGEDGRSALLTVIEPYNWLGEIALFGDCPRTHDAHADGETLVLQVPRLPLLALLRAEPRHWYDLSLLLACRLRVFLGLMEEAALLPALSRVARRLAMIADGYGELCGHTRRVLRVPQEQLAMMLSLSRQTTNQILKDLEGRGLVALRYGEIEVLDLDGLRSLAA